jgi:cyclase
MMIGYDLKLLKSIAEEVNIPVVACGGAGNLAHMKEALEIGVHAVAAGSLFVYHGERRGVLINYPSLEEKRIFIR